jgi:thymidylate synthase
MTFTYESEYLSLVKDCIDCGYYKEDRTKVGCKSLFGQTLNIDLTNNKLPILTTRKINYRNAFEEFLFMFKGLTDTTILENKGVNIWKGNTSREFLNSNPHTKGFNDGEMGYMYGHNWRYFGEFYGERDWVEGYNQMYELINGLINSPNSRRHLITTFNPSVKEKVLMECHGIATQFHVTSKGLILEVYNRSQDLILGTPTNIVFYSLFAHLIAHCLGTQAIELIWHMGDAHVYSNHEDKFINKQFNRQVNVVPTLKINKQLPSTNNAQKVIDYIESLTFEDFEVIDYNSHSGLLFDMAV